MDIQGIKQRFGVIGNAPLLYRAIDTAIQVAPTDITVLISGESGVGKEVFPKIIHQLSARKHGNYIAVNCGAIPEGTIDSELFGHEKGAFTGAHDNRKGYFEVASGGTIFLDEVAELPLSTQVRLLRVLESGEFMRVGSSKVIKTDVRVVAATNVNILAAIQQGKFREDLYYRLNTVPIFVPPLRDRKEDIHLLFRKFAVDFSERYRVPPMQLSDEARVLLEKYRWPGNVRQLRNITEQISIIEQERIITAEILQRYLPDFDANNLPVLFQKPDAASGMSDRDLLYKVLFDMKRDITELKQLVFEILQDPEIMERVRENESGIVDRLENSSLVPDIQRHGSANMRYADNPSTVDSKNDEYIEESEIIEESLSLQQKEIDMIKKALEKYKGKRKSAAAELGISERTLYRKIKEHNIKA